MSDLIKRSDLHTYNWDTPEAIAAFNNAEYIRIKRDGFQLIRGKEKWVDADLSNINNKKNKE